MTPKESLGRVRIFPTIDPVVAERLKAATDALHLPSGNIIDLLVFDYLDDLLQREMAKRGKT